MSALGNISDQSARKNEAHPSNPHAYEWADGELEAFLMQHAVESQRMLSWGGPATSYEILPVPKELSDGNQVVKTKKVYNRCCLIS
jgi:hypothetical protein